MKVYKVTAESAEVMANLLERAMMIEAWHSASDHAKDGTPLGEFLCNCERVVDRAIALGWKSAPND